MEYRLDGNVILIYTNVVISNNTFKLIVFSAVFKRESMVRQACLPNRQAHHDTVTLSLSNGGFPD